MTWPFENDTSVIIKKLAAKSVKADKQRLFYTSVTMAAAVALIMTLTCTFFFTQRKMSMQADTMPQAFLYDIPAEDYETLKNDSRVKKIVSLYSFQPVKYAGDISLQTAFSSDPAAFAGTVLTGELPRRENEIVLTSGSLAYLPDGTAIGTPLSLNLGKGERKYVVSGILEAASERAKVISVYCSEEYLLETASKEELRYTLYLYFNNCENWSQNDFMEQLEQLSLKYQIPLTQTSVNYRYLVLSNQAISPKEAFQFLLIVLVVFFAAAVVIYNIFYISISRKIQEYGQLRTIGMTPRQVRRMISSVGRKVAFPNILAGIVTGSIVSYVIQPEGWYWIGMLLAAFLSFLFGILTVTISIHSPAKLAGKVSPVAAVNYSGYPNEKIAERRKRYKITPLTLAIRNLTRNKKKTALTVLSLGLCGVMLIACASMRNSLSEENMARTQEFQYGDFKLEFEGDASILEQLGGEAQNYRRAALQANSDVFSSALARQILSIDGVTGIKEWYGTTALFSVNGIDMAKDATTVWGYTENACLKMEKNLVTGTIDTADLLQNNGIVVNTAENVPQEVYHWTPQIGDQVTFSFWSSTGNISEETFTVMGITDGSDGFGGIFRFPLKQLQAVTDYDITSDWEIITAAGKNDTVETALQALVKNTPELSLSTLQDFIDTLSGQYQSGIFMIYVLVLFLAVFGIINLVNLTVTNQLIRKKESGILLAVGLTKRQLRQSRIYEGELLVLASAFLTSVAGIPLSYVVTNTFKVAGAVEQYLFPFAEYGAFLLVLCFTEIALELLLNRSLQQESLVGLIKSN